MSIFHLTWVQADTSSAACPAHPGNLDMISMTFAAVICDADDPCSVNTAIRSRIIFSQYRLGVQLDLCIFGALSPIRHSSNCKCPSVRQNELLRPSSLLPLVIIGLLTGSPVRLSRCTPGRSLSTRSEQPPPLFQRAQPLPASPFQ